MAINYGQAKAGNLTLDKICDMPFGLPCSGQNGEAWWRAGRQWAAFTRSLVEMLKKRVDVKDWSAEVLTAIPAAEEAAGVFDGGQPWLYFQSRIESYATAQQTLRDSAGVVATFLESRGFRFSGPPADTPTSNTWAWIVGGTLAVTAIGVTAYVLTRPKPAASLRRQRVVGELDAPEIIVVTAAAE